jgi:hypothetical protein
MAFAPDSSHIVVEGRARSMQPAATGTWVAGASPDFLAKEEVRVAVTKIGTQVKLIGANIGNVPWGHASSLPVTVNLDAENLYFSYSGARELQGRYFIKVQPGAPESALDVVPETDNSFGGRFNLTAILKNAGLHGVQNVKIMVGVVGPGSTPAGARVVLDDFKLESVTAFAPTTVLRPVSGPSAALKAGGIASVQDALKIKANVADRVKAEGPKIFTHLVHWWGPNGTHWNLFGHNPQKDPKDIAAVNHPLLGNYDASTPAYNRWLVRTAKAMGINGVNVDYYAGTEPQDGAALDRLFEAAEAEGKFSVSVMLETRLAKGNLVVLKAQIKTILDKYAVRPSFQRVAGVPVIYTFGLSSTGITPDGYASVIKDLEAEGYVFLLIGDTTTQPAYDGVTSGDHEWINMGVVGKDGRYGSAVGSWEGYQHLNFVARTRDKKTIFSIASIYPGFDDSGVGGNWGQGKPRILDPGNGQVLESTIGAAVEHADRNLWAQVDTWDDHHEATTVEPTLEYGFDRLFSLMVFSARYRGVSSDPQQIINLTESCRHPGHCPGADGIRRPDAPLPRDHRLPDGPGRRFAEHRHHVH